VVMPLVAADVGGQQPVHPAAEVTVAGWPQRQVEMVVHQAERQHPHGRVAPLEHGRGLRVRSVSRVSAFSQLAIALELLAAISHPLG
jgi:hypothetical protein